MDLDFVNQRYWGGQPSDFMSGTLAIDSNGLNIPAGRNINGTAAMVSLLSTPGDYTIYAEVSPLVPNSGQSPCVLSINGTAVDAPLFVLISGPARNFHTNSAGSIDTLNRFGPFYNRKMATSQSAAAGRSIAQNGTVVATASAASNLAAVTSIKVGRYGNDTLYLNAYLRRIAIWNSKISDADLVSITGPMISSAPFSSGAGVIRGLYNEYLNVGNNVLQYEYTQPWTMWCAAKLIATPDVSGASLAAILHTNVSALSVFPGWETYIDSSGKLHVRLIHDISTSFVGVSGSTNVIDGNWHVLVSTWDGSGSASGVKLYVDGVAETLSTESDTLGGQSIVGGTQTLLVGNQTNRLGYYLMGFSGGFQLHNVARDAAWAAAHASSSTVPVPDANTALAYDFAGSGTTVTDQSGNGRNGTLSTVNMRV
jgi:hypothetical protein